MNNNEIEKLLSNLSNKKMSEKQVAENLMNKLNPEQTKQVENILSDPQKTQEILNSKTAQALIKRLMNNG